MTAGCCVIITITACRLFFDGIVYCYCLFVEEWIHFKWGGKGSTITIRTEGDLTLLDSDGSGVITGGNQSGVYVHSRSNFTMYGGTISDNSSSDNGGGVYVAEISDFTMNGGTIRDNRTSKCGGGVSILYGLVEDGNCFTMTGGAEMIKWYCNSFG